MCSMGMEDHQRAIVATLLCARPRMLELAELAALDGVERVEEAVHHWREDGVVVRLGDLVGVSRAAMRYRELMDRS
jgi:hypothetical protein